MMFDGRHSIIRWKECQISWLTNGRDACDCVCPQGCIDSRVCTCLSRSGVPRVPGTRPSTKKVFGFPSMLRSSGLMWTVDTVASRACSDVQRTSWALFYQAPLAPCAQTSPASCTMTDRAHTWIHLAQLTGILGYWHKFNSGRPGALTNVRYFLCPKSILS